MHFCLLSMVIAAQSPSDSFQSYRAHIAAATTAVMRGDVRAANDWLANAPKAHRGWEWTYLKGQCSKAVGSAQVTNASVTRVELSPDGSTLAVACSDKKIRLYDSKNLSLLGELSGHTNSVHGLAFSPDGKSLVTTSRDNSIRLWDVATKANLGDLGSHPVTPYNARFSPDGKKVVSVGWQMSATTKSPVGLIRVWDVASRKMLNSRDYSAHPISSLTFSPSGDKCYIGCWEFQTVEMDMTSYEILREISPTDGKGYKAVDWVELDPDNNRLVTACKDKTIKLFDLKSGKMDFEIGQNAEVSSVRVVKNSPFVLTGAVDGTVRIFDVATQKPVATLLGHEGAVYSLALSADGCVAYSGDKNGKILKWDVSSPATIEPQIDMGGGWSCVFSPDGKYMASGSNKRTIEIRTNSDLTLTKSIGKFGSLVVDTCWSPDSRQIAGGSNDGSFRVFDVASEKELWKFQGKGQLRSAAWSRNGQYVSSGEGGTGIGYVWSAKDGTEVLQNKMTVGTLNVAFDPKSQFVVMASSKKIELLDLATKKKVRTFEDAPSDIFDLAVSPNGQNVVVGCNSGEICWYRVKDGKRLWTNKTDTSQWGVSISPDGKRIASTGYDFALHLIDPSTGLEVFRASDMPIQGFDVNFSADGRRLAYMGGEGLIWMLALPKQDR